MAEKEVINVPRKENKIVAESETNRWDAFLDWLLAELLKGGYIHDVP